MTSGAIDWKRLWRKRRLSAHIFAHSQAGADPVFFGGGMASAIARDYTGSGGVAPVGSRDNAPGQGGEAPVS